MARKTKTTTNADPALTLSGLAEKYLEHLESEGRSAGTCFSYLQELRTAFAELGATTPVADLTAEKIAAYNTCTRVMRLKSGKPKAEPSYFKTRRVLRLCLAWGEQAGVIAKSPVPADKDVLPDAPAQPEPSPKKAAKPRKAKAVEPEPDAAPTPDDTPAPDAVQPEVAEASAA